MVCVCAVSWVLFFFGPPYPTESCPLLGLVLQWDFSAPLAPLGPSVTSEWPIAPQIHSSLSTKMFVCPFCPFVWPQSLLLHEVSQPGRFKLKRGYLYMREVMSLAMYFGLQSLELNISVPKMELKRRDDFPIKWKLFAEGWVQLFQKKKKNQLASACIIQLTGESKEWDSLPEKRWILMIFMMLKEPRGIWHWPKAGSLEQLVILNDSSQCPLASAVMLSAALLGLCSSEFYFFPSFLTVYCMQIIPWQT